MLPDLSILLSILLGLFALSQSPSGDVDVLRAVAGTAAAVTVVLALTRMAADRAIAAVEAQDAEALVRAGRMTGLWPLLGWVTTLQVFGWGDFVVAKVPRAWFLVPHLLVFLPLALMVGAGWMAGRRVEARFVAGAPSAWGAVRRGLRRNGLVLAPLAVLVAVQEAFVSLAALGVPGVKRLLLVHEAFPDVEALLVLAIMVLVGWFAPEMLRRMLRTRPMPAGPARAEIERLCAALGVRYRDLLLWETGGRTLNAMVVGLTGGTRYVVVTDALLDRLPMPEVLAVVAHEAGHARLRHLPAYFALSLAALLFMQSAQEMLLPVLPEGGNLVLALGFLGFFWFGMLGWLSRRFERQADVFGAEHAGALSPDAPPVALVPDRPPVPYGAAAMISALTHVVEHAGTGRSHRHGTIADRTAFLAAYATEAAVRDDHRRRTTRLRWGVRGFVLLALVTTALRLPVGLDRGRAGMRFDEAQSAYEDASDAQRAGRAAEAAAGFARAREGFLATAAVREERPGDLPIEAYATVSLLRVAYLDQRVEEPAAQARAQAGYERVLELARRLGGVRGALASFAARVGLARVALRDADRARGLAAARRRLSEAEAMPAIEADAAIREATLRALRAAIRQFDADAEVAAQARRDLERMSKPARDDLSWRELAADAAADLALPR